MHASMFECLDVCLHACCINARLSVHIYVGKHVCCVCAYVRIRIYVHVHARLLACGGGRDNPGDVSRIVGRSAAGQTERAPLARVLSCECAGPMRHKLLPESTRRDLGDAEA